MTPLGMVIRAARFAGRFTTDDKVDDHIAAAVVAWIQEPAQIERMARAARPDAWAEDGAIGELVSADAKAKYYAGLRKVLLQRTRAAIAALSELQQ